MRDDQDQKSGEDNHKSYRRIYLAATTTKEGGLSRGGALVGVVIVGCEEGRAINNVLSRLTYIQRPEKLDEVIRKGPDGVNHLAGFECCER